MGRHALVAGCLTTKVCVRIVGAIRTPTNANWSRHSQRAATNESGLTFIFRASSMRLPDLFRVSNRNQRG